MIKHTHAYTHTHTPVKTSNYSSIRNNCFRLHACSSRLFSLSRFSIRILRSQKNNPEMKAQESMLIFNYG